MRDNATNPIETSSRSARFNRLNLAQAPDLGSFRSIRGDGNGLLRQQAFHDTIRAALFIESELPHFPTTSELVERLEQGGLAVSHDKAEPGVLSKSSVFSFAKRAKLDLLNLMRQSILSVYEEKFEHDRDLLNKLTGPIEGTVIYRSASKAVEKKLAREILVNVFQMKMSGAQEISLPSDFQFCTDVSEEFLKGIFPLSAPFSDELIGDFEPYAKRFVMLHRFGMEKRFFDSECEAPCSLVEAKTLFRQYREQALKDGRDPDSGATVCNAIPWLYYRLSQAVSQSKRKYVAPLIVEVLGARSGTAVRKDWGVATARREFYEDLLADERVGGDPLKIQKHMVAQQGKAIARYYFPDAHFSDHVRLSGQVLVRLIEEFSDEPLSELVKDQIIDNKSVAGLGHLVLRFYQSSMGISDYQKVLRRTAHHTGLRLRAVEKEIAGSDEPTAEIAKRYRVGSLGIENLRIALREANIPKVGVHVLYSGKEETRDVHEILPRTDMSDLPEIATRLRAHPLTLSLLGRFSGRRPCAIKSLKFSTDLLGTLQNQIKLTLDTVAEAGEVLNRQRVEGILETISELQRRGTDETITVPKRGEEGQLIMQVTSSSFSTLEGVCEWMREELHPRHFLPWDKGELPQQ